MEYDPAKLDETVLALLYLNVSTTATAWKGFDWGSLDRLHSRGLISNPKSKAKSVELTESGARLKILEVADPFGNRLCFNQPL